MFYIIKPADKSIWSGKDLIDSLRKEEEVKEIYLTEDTDMNSLFGQMRNANMIVFHHRTNIEAVFCALQYVDKEVIRLMKCYDGVWRLI